MRILGIDPGYAIVGYGAVECLSGKYRPLTYGAILTEAEESFPRRLETIYHDLLEILDTWKPEAVSIEKLFFYNNQKTAISVAEARGVILLALQKKNLPIFEYTPLQVKVAVTGYGGAGKLQVMEMTRRLLHLKEIPRPDDAADALAMAICHGQSAVALRRRSSFLGGN